MFSLFWHWSPQFFLPWSGSVRQDIELDRFFQAIPASAGDGAVEEAAFKRASYGSQLGWITEVLLETMKEVAADENNPLGKLRLAHADIQRMKLERQGMETAEDEAGAAQIAALLRDLRQRDSTRHAQVSQQIMQLLQLSQKTEPMPALQPPA